MHLPSISLGVYYFYNVFLLQVVKTFILPYTKSIGERLQYALDGPLINSMDKTAGDHLKVAVVVSQNEPLQR